MSSRASLMFVQTLVPTSTTDWCISALTASCSASLALGRISGVNVRAQIAGLRIDGLVFLFNSDAEAGPVHRLSLWPLAKLLKMQS